jgi:SNF2 family DNA or RNA helicase
VFDAKSRVKEVVNIIEECSTKLIVFAPFVAVVKMIHAELKKEGIESEMIYGDVSKSERDRIFGEFQSPHGAKVLVAQPAAMSHGLTLTEASTIIWYAPIYSNDIFEQANGRITRPGQRNNQFIIMLEGSPIERKVYERLKAKQQVQGTLLEMMKHEALV